METTKDLNTRMETTKDLTTREVIYSPKNRVKILISRDLIG